MKNVLVALAGIVVGVLTVAIVESIGHLIYPPPAGVDLKDPEQLAAIIDTIPFPAKLMVLLAWGLGTFGGGVTGVFLSGRKAWPAGVVALVMLLAAGWTLFIIPHPIWMIAATLVITAVAWLLATRFARDSG
jgi:membrane protein YdbS with pleckstrin-like domain